MIKQVTMLIFINFLNFFLTFPHPVLAALQAEAQLTKQSVPALVSLQLKRFFKER